MNLKQIEAFVTVAQTKSFSQSASKLYLTQPTVSAHISSLENELNVKLLARTTKEVDLTKNGEQLLPHAIQMIDLQKRIETMFQGNQNSNEGVLRIACSSIPARCILPAVLEKYTARYPDAKFDIKEDDSIKVIESVSENLINIGFTGTQVEREGCKFIKLYRDELVVIMPNDEKHSKLSMSNDLSWIQEYPVIMREEGSGTRVESEKILFKKGIDVSSLNVVASIGSTDTIVRLVKSNMGVAFVSKIAVSDKLKSGELLSIPLSQEGQGRYLYLVYNNHFLMSKQMERFIDITKSLYK